MVSIEYKMLHDEDRKLQIRLAVLQADVQTYSTCAFGFLAAFAAIILTYMQMSYFLPTEQFFMKSLFQLLIFILAPVCFVVFLYFVRKVQDARDKMEKLEKQYQW